MNIEVRNAFPKPECKEWWAIDFGGIELKNRTLIVPDAQTLLGNLDHPLIAEMRRLFDASCKQSKPEQSECNISDTENTECIIVDESPTQDERLW